MDNMCQKKISIVVSVFNEELVLIDFYKEIKRYSNQYGGNMN